MTRKHFEAIARDLRNFCLELPAEDRLNGYYKDLINDLMLTFEDINPNFDRKRFISAIYDD